MAIEISPRIKIKVPVWTIIVTVVLLILLISLTVVYFYIAFSLKKMSKELEERNITVVPLEEAITEKEEELQPINQEIDDFNELLAAHKKTLDIFTFLERTCLPFVWFSDFDLNSNAGKVSISGQVDSFATLEQQINVLRQESALISSNITEILIDEEGIINFTLSLIFK
jgi:hypothetical protein